MADLCLIISDLPVEVRPQDHNCMSALKGSKTDDRRPMRKHDGVDVLGSAYELLRPVQKAGVSFCAGTEPKLLPIADHLVDELLALRRGLDPQLVQSLDAIARDIATTSGIHSRKDMHLWPAFPGSAAMDNGQDGDGYEGMRWVWSLLPNAT